MSKLEEIRDAVVAEIEKVWHELTGTVDVDKARAVIADSAATLTQHVSALGQHLFDHVLGNSQAAEAAPAADPVPSDGEPTQELATANGAPITAGEPTFVGEQIGGHAAGDSTPTADMPAVDEAAPEQSA